MVSSEKLPITKGQFPFKKNLNGRPILFCDERLELRINLNKTIYTKWMHI